MTAIEKQPKQDAAGAMVKALAGSVKSALPAHVTLEHFQRAMLTEFRRTPKLLECTRESVGAAVVTAAQLGLMLGVNGAAWLIPFKTDATLVIGYQGMVDLCYRSDRVDSVFSDVVCANDQFEYEQGLTPKLRHVPNLKGARGEPYAVYAIAKIRGSESPLYVLLNREEVMNVKGASFGARKSDSPWNGKFETEMWKKTAIRRLCKFLPKSVDLQNALEFENRQAEREREVEASVVAEAPLSPGRHEMRKTPAPEKQAVPEPAPVDIPENACGGYRMIAKYAAEKPDALNAAIEAARAKYPECEKIQTWRDIDHSDVNLCGQILGEMK